jgi:hypothetical protein
MQNDPAEAQHCWKLRQAQKEAIISKALVLFRLFWGWKYLTAAAAVKYGGSASV